MLHLRPNKILVMFSFLSVSFFWLIPGFSFAQQRRTIVGNLIFNVTSTINMLVTLLFVVALLVFAWGIIRLIVAASEGPQQLERAKTILLWGVIGMAVLASIGGIILFAQNFFGIQNAATTTITVPQFPRQ